MIGTDKLKVNHISARRGTTLLKNQYPKQAKSIAYAPQPAPNCRRSVRRLFRHKDALLRVLDRPEIPLNTNASENDIRAFVTKRKISGGTVSDRGRDARDIMLGLAKTCMKLKLSFYEFLGDRLGIPGAQIPHLAELIRPAPS